jgi:hypothetical protein
MSITHDRAGGAPLFVEFRPSTRSLIEDAIESLLLLLDEIDGDVDIEMDEPPEEDDPAEDGGESEPSLGAPGAAYFPDQAQWAQGVTDDREENIGPDDREHDYEAERSGCGDMDGVLEQHGFGVQFAE